jgi:hypothetical protein
LVRTEFQAFIPQSVSNATQDYVVLSISGRRPVNGVRFNSIEGLIPKNGKAAKQGDDAGDGVVRRP